MVNSVEAAQFARTVVRGATSLTDAAYGCRAGGLDPVTCAPILLQQFPGTSALDMGSAISLGWCGIMNATLLTSALAAASYSSSDITAALPQILHLTWVDNASYSNPSLPLMPKVHALYQGDLTKLSSGEVVDFLVVSCLPGDYTPSPGTLLGALAAIGVSVQQLSSNKAADYRTQYNCWISQPIQSQSFAQLIVFESTGAAAPANVSGIFQSLQTYWPSPHSGTVYPYADIATPLVSTGAAGGNPTAVMTALFNAAKAMLNGTYNLGCLRTVIFISSEVAPMKQVFDSLKG